MAGWSGALASLISASRHKPPVQPRLIAIERVWPSLVQSLDQNSLKIDNRLEQWASYNQGLSSLVRKLDQVDGCLNALSIETVPLEKLRSTVGEISVSYSNEIIILIS